MPTSLHWRAILVILAVPLTAWGCEPIVPLGQLLSGSTLAGPLLLTRSLVWLAVAVMIKCAVFVFSERRLSWYQAIPFMVLANVVSTIPGVLVAAFASTVIGVIFAIPLVYVLGKIVERRLSWLPEPGALRAVSGGRAALLFIAFFLGSMVVYALAQSALFSGSGFGQYWALKFLFVTMVAGTGMLISAVLEECVIARCSRKEHGNLSFFTPVFRANYVALIIVLLVAALKILPMRLRAPHFLVSWMHSVSAMLGLS
jgi:hypothetical protein